MSKVKIPQFALSDKKLAKSRSERTKNIKALDLTQIVLYDNFLRNLKILERKNKLNNQEFIAALEGAVNYLANYIFVCGDAAEISKLLENDGSKYYKILKNSIIALPLIDKDIDLKISSKTKLGLAVVWFHFNLANSVIPLENRISIVLRYVDELLELGNHPSTSAADSHQDVDPYIIAHAQIIKVSCSFYGSQAIDLGKSEKLMLAAVSQLNSAYAYYELGNYYAQTVIGEYAKASQCFEISYQKGNKLAKGCQELFLDKEQELELEKNFRSYVESVVNDNDKDSLDKILKILDDGDIFRENHTLISLTKLYKHVRNNISFKKSVGLIKERFINECVDKLILDNEPDQYIQLCNDQADKEFIVEGLHDVIYKQLANDLEFDDKAKIILDNFSEIYVLARDELYLNEFFGRVRKSLSAKAEESVALESSVQELVTQELDSEAKGPSTLEQEQTASTHTTHTQSITLSSTDNAVENRGSESYISKILLELSAGHNHADNVSAKSKELNKKDQRTRTFDKFQDNFGTNTPPAKRAR